MSRAVPLSRIQELGIRGRDDPAAQTVVWNVISMDDGSLRALHEALNPTLLLLALAGYRIDRLVLGPLDENGDVLLVELSPRKATKVAWADYMESETAEWPFSGRFGVLVWLKPHPGITGEVVPIDATGAFADHFVTIEGFDYLGYDTTTPGFLNVVLYFLTWDQDAIRRDLAARIATAWEDTDWDTSTTGLLAALQPDLWTFPDLDDDEDLRRQAFRQLGEPIADAALDDAGKLEEFLIEEAVVRADGVPRSVHDRLVTLVPDDAADLERNWNSEAEALWDEHNENGDRGPFRAADHRRLSYCELVFDMLNESLISLAGYDPAAGESAYGGYDLQRGDRDPAEGEAEWVYAGQAVTGTATTYIADLRLDLERVGFGPLADGDVHLAVPDPEQPDAEARRRTFGAHLESAVREFQIYASLPSVGRLPREDELPEQDHPSLGSTLIQETNDQPYSGPISGVLNASTRALLKMWVERDWHCPVVVEARELERDAHLEVLRDPASQVDKAALVTGVPIDDAHQNLWRRNQLEDLRKDSDGPYAFIVWDRSGHYPQAPGRRAGDPVVIARWAKGGSWGGAYARAGWHTWPESECTPVSLLGQTPVLAERPQQGAFWSTYRVLRAVSECECQGVLDGMNAYDSAILSGGPIHFTLGLAKNPKGRGLSSGPGPCIIYPGELCPALSLLADEDPAEYERYFGIFGLEPREPWDDPPAAMFSSAHRKYRGWVRLQDDEGSFADTRVNVPVPIPAAQDHAVSHDDLLLIEVLHHWHWIYRWQMAPRLSRVFREVTYRLSRARLRALRSTPWGTSGYTLGQVFTSELAVAILERLHVYSPPDLFGDLKDKEAETGGQTVADIKFTLIDDAYDEAVKTGGADPTTWGDAEEKALVDKLVALNLKDDIPKVVEWPNEDSYRGRLHDVSVLPIAKEEAPEIGAIASVAVAPGTEARVRFTVTDRETEPGGCDLFVTSSNEDRLVASVEPAGGIQYDLVLEAPAGAAGAVTVTVTARDPRQKTTREVLVNVTAGGQAPQGAGAYVRPAAVGLSQLRDSFQLDDAGLFAQPPG
jgi:hypothetical protein